MRTVIHGQRTARERAVERVYEKIGKTYFMRSVLLGYVLHDRSRAPSVFERKQRCVAEREGEGEMLNAVCAGISLICTASNDYSSGCGGGYTTSILPSSPIRTG